MLAKDIYMYLHVTQWNLSIKDCQIKDTTLIKTLLRPFQIEGLFIGPDRPYIVFPCSIMDPQIKDTTPNQDTTQAIPN